MVCLWLHNFTSDYLSITTVDLRFILSGHLFLPDRDFSNIELAKRQQSIIYVPDE